MTLAKIDSITDGWRRAALLFLAAACHARAVSPTKSTAAPTALASASDASAPVVSTSSTCALGATATIADGDSGELIATRIAASGDVALVELERQGHDEHEGWDGAKPHFVWMDASTFPQRIDEAPVMVSSAVAAPYAMAAPIGGDRISSLIYGQEIDWSFELATLSSLPTHKMYDGWRFFQPRNQSSYVPPSYVPNTLEAAGTDTTSPLRAAAITTGHDLGGKRVEDCFETAAGTVPPCHGLLWTAADELAVVGFPRSGAPWTKKIPVPVAVVPGEKYAEIGPIAIAMGKTRGAYAFRYKGAMWLGWIGATAADVTAPVKIREGKLGAPTMAMSGDELVVMWAERTSDADPWRLAYTRFGESKASATEVLERGFAPSLAATPDGYTLAWMDGEARATGWIRAARFERETTPSLVSASDLTPRTGNSRDPEVAVSGGRAWIVWQEFPAKSNGKVRVASLTCPR